MSYTANIINGVLAALQDAAQGGTGELPVEPGDIAMLVSPMGGQQKPYIVVRLPTEPYTSAAWGGSSNLRNAIFIVDVDVVGETVPENPQPYGSDANTGILTLADDVMDVLENAREALLNTTPRLYDYELTAAAHQRGEDARTVSVTIRCSFKIRFFAGRR